MKIQGGTLTYISSVDYCDTIFRLEKFSFTSRKRFYRMEWFLAYSFLSMWWIFFELYISPTFLNILNITTIFHKYIGDSKSPIVISKFNIILSMRNFLDIYNYSLFFSLKMHLLPICWYRKKISDKIGILNFIENIQRINFLLRCQV